MHRKVMRRFHNFCLATVMLASLVLNTLGAEFKSTNGDIYKGEASSFNDEGLIVRLEIGGFSPRLNWSRLTQETLMEVSKNPAAAKFAEAFIDVPAEAKPVKKKKEIVVKPVPRVERPAKAGLFASWSSPVGMALLLSFFVANLYAAFEIARYRNRPAAVICTISALIPVFGPLLFLSMPTLEEHNQVDEGAGAAGETVAEAPKAAAKAPAAASGGGLGLAAHDKGKADTGGDKTVYKRGDTTFNRRFFETKFPGFFRVVPAEADKDLALVIRGPKSEHVAKRISRISMTEMHIQPVHGGGEVAIPFGEISEVLVRNKDAKA